MKELFRIRHSVYDGGSEMVNVITVVRAEDANAAMIGFNKTVDTRFDKLCTIKDVSKLKILEV